MNRILRIYKTLDAIPTMFLDGCIAVGIAMLTTFSVGLAQEDSYKYVNPVLRFWLVLILGAMVQGAHALSKFRDATFTRHNDARSRKQIAEETSAQLEAHPEGIKLSQIVSEETTTVIKNEPVAASPPSPTSASESSVLDRIEENTAATAANTSDAKDAGQTPPVKP